MLDMDDDLYWYSFDTLGFNVTSVVEADLNILEVYQIHVDFPITINQYGNWTSLQGLKTTHLEKYSRRRDMQMAPFKVCSLPSQPYVTQMNPIGEGFYDEFEGMFAEIFNNLQVC
jgi:hypothetical protein